MSELRPVAGGPWAGPARFAYRVRPSISAPLVAVWVAVTLLAVALVGCGGAGSSAVAEQSTSTTSPARFRVAYTTTGPFSTLAESTRAAGSVLVKGLVVPAGSVMLGPTFPDFDGSGGFLALGLVLNDPVAVFNDYVGQAGQLGMSVSDGGGCLPARHEVACVRTLTDPGDGEALAIRIQRRVEGRELVSHVALHYQAPGSVALDGIARPRVSPPTDPLPTVALPASVPRAPDDAINGSIAHFGPVLALEQGSVLVGPAGPCGCGPSGWSVVLRVTGTPAEVMAAYSAAMTRQPVKTKSRILGQRRVVEADLGLVAPGFTQLRSVTESGTTFLLIAVVRP